MKRAIFVWSLYDFANSFVFITFLVYFSKWLVVDRGFADWLYNGTFIIGSIALIFLAPFMGRRADQFGFTKRYLVHSTLTCFVCYALTVAGAVTDMNVFLTALFFTVGNFFYQLSFVFYNPLLQNISTPENRGRISGVGFLANYAGQIAALLLSLPLVNESVSIGVAPLVAPLLVATIIFFLLALPLLLSKTIFTEIAPSAEAPIYKDHRNLIKIIYATPPLFLFLLAFFFFSDAVNTFINNFSIFTANVFHTTDGQIAILTLSAVILAGLGAIAWGWLADKIGAIKVMAIILTLWVVALSLAAAAPTYPFFFSLALMGGILVGGTWSVARTLLMSLTPSGMTGYVFGLYAVSERAATILGPILWSLVLVVGGYRWVLFSLAGFQAVSMYLIFKMLKASAMPAS